MAHVFPALDELDHLPTPLNEGEHQVLERLCALDDEWRVYVQPRLGLDMPDFVVLHPKYGVTAVEVKDWGHGCYRQTPEGVIEVLQDGGWERTRHNPKFQAARYLDAIWARFFTDVNAAPRRATVRACVVMPRYTTADARQFLRYEQFRSERGVDVWGGDDLERSPLLVLTNSPSPANRRIPEIAVERLRRALAEPSTLTDLRLPLRLSDAAQNIERNPSNASIRRVRGAAGSGKSLGLAARAARLSAEGKDVLVVTYNSTLPHYLHDLAARRCRQIDGADIKRIAFTHLHALCRRAVDNSKLAGADAIGRSLPGMVDPFEQLVDEAIDAYNCDFGRRFDAVLVDEGQDFTLKWWNFLREQVCRDDGELLLVADPTQDVYDQKAWTDEKRMVGAGFSGPWAEARGSYRMPPDLIPKIAAFAKHHVPGEHVEPLVPADHPQKANEYEPTVRRWVNASGPDSIGTHLGREVLRLIGEQHDLCVDDIVFLAERHEDGLDAVAVLEAAGVYVQHIFATKKEDRPRLKQQFYPTAPGVKGCTVQSFKGWESRAVVLSVGAGDYSHQLAYVALTRVKGDAVSRSAYVTVVNQDRSLQRFGEFFMAS